MLLLQTIARSTVSQSRNLARRHISAEGLKASSAARNAVVQATKARTDALQKLTLNGEKSNWWTNAELWGTMSAIAGWTMSIAAIYDSMVQGPEVISLNMTGVLIVYSSLFFRWAYVVRPQNLFLASCHFTNVCAQLNQMKRALEYKLDNGQEEEVKEVARKAAAVGGIMAGSIAAGPYVRAAFLKSENSIIHGMAATEAGPFRVHFWAPMSKWLISGASLADYDRPVEKVSIPQYSSLALCGLIHSRYALLVIPTNYMLFSVNVALLGSSSWHLARKAMADEK